MSKPVISISNVGKEYRLGMVNEVTLKGALSSLITSKKQKKNESFWALKDVNFDVNQGDVVGVIGKNGAGKSTLLKILSRITTPTTGRFEIEGRVSSLLEVGTGFHPELTGRENIFLNATILGMRKQEIKKRFDEIVAFSGVEKFIDTPTKHYSSGMYVRLAFSVAAHIDPEILILDEVLAVGDIAFQRKCIEKIENIAEGQGSTILFVSHNMETIKSFCSRAILLEQGQVTIDGKVDAVVDRYYESLLLTEELSNSAMSNRQNRGSMKVVFKDFEITNEQKEQEYRFKPHEKVVFKIKMQPKEKVNSLGLLVVLKNNGQEVTSFKSQIPESLLGKDIISCELEIPNLNLRDGEYSIYTTLSDGAFEDYYDHFDENVNLPNIIINSGIQDLHLTAGITNMDHHFSFN